MTQQAGNITRGGRVRCTLSPLTDQERQAFEMVRAGKKMREIAAHFRVPEGTAQSWVNKAREAERIARSGGTP